jgi:acyl-CoA synthetase (NDP forming)
MEATSYPAEGHVQDIRELPECASWRRTSVPLELLEKLFRPRSIAVIGASTREDAIGFRVIRNLHAMGFGGEIYPINPRYREIAGLPCLPAVEALPRGVESAFIAIPAEQVPEILDAVGRHGIRSAFVNASGFADGGKEGRALQRRLEAVAHSHGIALCGPNNMGLVNVHERIAIWTQLHMSEVRPGPVAVISQSGSVALVLARDERRLGLSYLVTTGNEAVLSAADYLDYIVDDRRVKTVLLFLESVRNPARFGAAARRAAALGKRVLAIKSGASVRGKMLVAAHTDSLAGDDAVYDAFFRKHGVLRVRDLDEMIETALLVTSYPEAPDARRFVPITLSGGEAALIADLSSQIGLALEPLADATIERLKPVFPRFARPNNPLDAWGLGFSSERFGAMLGALCADASIGAIGLAVDAPASGGADTAYALTMAEHAMRVRTEGKHIVFFNNTVGAGPNPQLRALLDAAGIPYLSGMRPALVAISKWLGLREPSAESALSCTASDLWRASLAASTALDEQQLYAVLREAGVPMVCSRVVRSPEEAVEGAAELGYPVVLKASSARVPHKTEHQLVRLGLGTAAAVRQAYAHLATRLTEALPGSQPGSIVLQPMLQGGVELIVGIRNDAAFGTLVIVGLGGAFVELIDSVAIRLAPVSVDEARAMLDETRAGELLSGFRGQPACDRDAAAAAIAALSTFGVATMGTVESLEINPLIVLDRGAFGVDVLARPPDLATEGFVNREEE